VADQKGNAEEAVALAKKAVTLDPYNAAPRKVLVLRLIGAKQYDEAQAAMEKYLQDFPQDEFMRKALAMAKSN
jgi:TolA-binding protein